jgi:peptide-methionine (S)-S-oxide reductase
METSEIGLGGSCHWCTEAIFFSLKGVAQVRQGWIASKEAPDRLSEAVVVRYDQSVIPLETLIAIHLYTHSCTSAHAMRDKYRSAVYTFSGQQQSLAAAIIHALQQQFSEPIITEVVPFSSFKLNKPEYLNYYYSGPEKPFCQNIVNPKLVQLLRDFASEVDVSKLPHLLPMVLNP